MVPVYCPAGPLKGRAELKSLLHLHKHSDIVRTGSIGTTCPPISLCLCKWSKITALGWPKKEEKDHVNNSDSRLFRFTTLKIVTTRSYY